MHTTISNMRLAAKRHGIAELSRRTADGCVTHLRVFVGDYASAGDARRAIIDSNPFYVFAYFKQCRNIGCLSPAPLARSSRSPSPPSRH